MKHIDLYNFAFFCGVFFFRIYLSMGDLESSGAGESMQNDLAHLSESARLHMDGFAGKTEKLRLYRHVDDTKKCVFLNHLFKLFQCSQL